MADFYDNRILPDEANPPSGDRPSSSQFQSHPGATSTSVLDSPMPTATSFNDALQNDSQGVRRELQQRRSSYNAPYDSPAGVFSQNAARRLSMMEFGTSDDALRSYQFSQDMVTDFTGAGVADPVGGFDQSTNMGGVPGFPFEMMSNMMPASFANMSVNPLAAGDPGMSLGGAQLGNTMGVHGSPVSLGPAEQGGHFLPGSSVMGAAAEEQRRLMNQGNLGAATGQQPFANDDASGMPIDTDTPMQLEETPTHPPPRPHPQPPRPQGRAPADDRMSNPLQAGPGRPPETKQKSVYSKSGFDMLRALWYVATRKNPEIHIGAVDMSCAFVVCDVTMNDCPIVYASDNFQNLTGYSRHEIMGKNCRFLQAPDGKVEAGVKREFVDDSAVYNLKVKVEACREVQQSLINYRKGGKPFLNLLTMVPIPWDTEEIRYFVGFQIDLVESPEAISSTQGQGSVEVDYKHSDIGQYIWVPPQLNKSEPDTGQTLGMEDVSTLLQQFITKGTIASEWHRQSWHKMLLENTDDVVHVLSLKGVFQYLSPTCKRILEYDPSELVGTSLSSVCHPSDIVPVTRELKDATADTPVNIVFRIRRKSSGYMWFESYGSLFSEQGKGRKCIILLGRKRPVYSLSRRSVHAHGGVHDSELWAKLSTSGMFLFVSSNAQLLLDLHPEAMVGSSIHDLMRKESRPEFGRAIEKARRGKVVDCKHEVHNRRGQVLQAHTFLYPGDGNETKPSFLLAQIKLIKASSRSPGAGTGAPSQKGANSGRPDAPWPAGRRPSNTTPPEDRQALPAGPDDVMFSELGTTKCSSWQFELRQMEKVNRILAEELSMLLTSKKKRKRRKGSGGSIIRDCANCHTRNTPEWRRGPSGQRDLCNSCGLRWAKQMGRVSPRNSSRAGSGGNGDSQNKQSNSSVHSSPLTQDAAGESFGDAERPSEGCAGRGSIGSGGESSANPGSGSSGSQQAMSMPPPSQPLLEGGSGVEMTSIREE